MNKTVRQTVIELVTGIWIYGILLAAIVLACMRGFSVWGFSHTKVLIGIASGCALSSFMAIHMAVSLDTAVDLGEQGAVQHTRKTYIIRTVIVLVCVVLLYYTGWVNILAMLGGLFGLKPAAYMQPVLHRIFTGKGEQQENDISGE